MACAVEAGTLGDINADVTLLAPHLKNPGKFVRRAAKRFFQETQCWRELSIPLTVAPVTDLYTVEHSPYNVCSILNVYGPAFHSAYDDEYKIPEHRNLQKVDRHNYTHDYYYRDQYWIEKNECTIQFNRQWESMRELRVEAALMPSDDGKIDPKVLSEHREVILNGALFYALSIPDEKTGRVRDIGMRDRYKLDYEQQIMGVRAFISENARPHRPTYTRNRRNNANRGNTDFHDRSFLHNE